MYDTLSGRILAVDSHITLHYTTLCIVYANHILHTIINVLLLNIRSIYSLLYCSFHTLIPLLLP